MTDLAKRRSNRGASRVRVFALLLILVSLLLVAGANAHLVYVATGSQPECIEHRVSPGKAPGQFRVAKPAC